MRHAGWPWLALALALWLPVWARWAEWWSARPEQTHGWLLPFFALWLAYDRWRDAPETAEPPPAVKRLIKACLVASLTVWTAGMLLLTPNAHWPTAQWMAGLGAAGVWLAAAALAGGARWSLHFVGAALFPLCAAAWPTMIQRPVLDVLGPWIAGAAAELVNLAGHPAIAQGAVIEVAEGWVGVDEACAGLRSLDAAVLMAWFIAEQRRLLWRGRLLLGLIALATAVLGNLARATALVWIAAAQNPAATEAWHDALGWSALIFTLGGVLLSAEAVETRFRRAASTRARPRPRAGAALGALTAALASWSGILAWYHTEEDANRRVGWTVAAAADEGNWRPPPKPSGFDEQLGGARWEGAAGEGPGWSALAYLIAWECDVARAEGAFVHGPEICLPGIGLVPVATLPTIIVEVGGSKLELAGTRYADAFGRQQYVWFARWDEFAGRTVGRGRNQASPTESRLNGVRERRRRALIAQIGIVLAGPDDDETARLWIEQRAPQLLLRNK